MKLGQYKTTKTREIIEDTISQLCAVGFSPDGAASLLVIQGMTRVQDNTRRKELAEFAAQAAEDTID